MTQEVVDDMTTGLYLFLHYNIKFS